MVVKHPFAQRSAFLKLSEIQLFLVIHGLPRIARQTIDHASSMSQESWPPILPASRSSGFLNAIRAPVGRIFAAVPDLQHKGGPIEFIFLAYRHGQPLENWEKWLSLAV